MKNFIFLIGSTDTFSSIEDLKQAYFDEDESAASYKIEIDPACKITGYSDITLLAETIGFGEAFADGWSPAGVWTYLIEVPGLQG